MKARFSIDVEVTDQGRKDKELKLVSTAHGWTITTEDGALVIELGIKTNTFGVLVNNATLVQP